MQSLINSCRINWKANELTWEISLLNWDRTFPSTYTTPRCHVYGIFIHSTHSTLLPRLYYKMRASINENEIVAISINVDLRPLAVRKFQAISFWSNIGNSEIETIFHFKIRTRFQCSRNTTFVPYLFFKWQKMLILNLSKVN